MKSRFDFRLFTRTIQLARPYRREFFTASALAIALAIITPLTPYLIQRTVDRYILLNDLQGLIYMTMVLLILLMAGTILQYFFLYLTRWLGLMVINRLRTRVFDHIVSLRLKYFDTTPIGTSTTRTINDVETINDVFSQGIITLIADGLSVIAVIIMMFVTDWRLTLATLAVFPFLLIATYVFQKKVKVAFHAVRTELAKMNAFLQEHITGMKIVQIFTAEEKEMRKFVGINRNYRTANIKTIWYYSIFFPVVEILLAVAIALVVWYGAMNVLSGFTTLGVLIAFLLYLNLLFRPIRMMADKFNALQMGLVASERVFKVLDSSDQMENTGRLKPEDIRGEIEFDGVWFAYNDEDYVLRDISFRLEPGTTIAIVGATGSGKSSVINILNRFYEIQKGQIRVDGMDIREYELQAYRHHIGNVQQDVFLFSGTIFENITLRNRSMSMDDVVEAAKICGIHDFIQRLPGQYGYNVMERGATLSLGQRQLIAFIRTLVFDPAILIMDEATSSIDRESEMLIQNAIEKLITNRTSIIIAHRLSTIRRAQQILVLDKGRIMETGTHQELLLRDGYYRRLYELQFRKQELA